MRKIIDEIFLHFSKKFLAIKIKKTEGQPDQCKGKGYTAYDPEIHFTQYILGTMRKIKEYMIVFTCEDRQSLSCGNIEPRGSRWNIVLINIFFLGTAISPQFNIGQNIKIPEFFT